MHNRSVAEPIAWMAGRQHGVVARWQLLALGMSPAAISRRIAGKSLHPLFPGVYAVGHRGVSKDGWAIAAVLYAGEGAALGCRSAADRTQIRTWNGPWEIIASRRVRPRRNLIAHCIALPQDEVVESRGIPITTPSRTIFDLAGVLDLRGLRSAINEAHALRLPLRPSLPTLLERHPRRPGAANLWFLLAEDQVRRGITRRQFEAAFFAFLAEEGFPPPLINHPILAGDETFTVDFAWPSARLIVETDGDAFHSSPQRRSADKRRDRRLRAIGWSVIRVAWEHLHGGRGELRDDLWLALGRPAEAGRRAGAAEGSSPPPPRSASPPRPS